jgi:hypothetical protein
MKEFSDSIKATLYERATSPLYSTFVFSWVICNWKIPIVLLFGDKSGTRMEFIENYIQTFGLLNLLIYPLMWALLLLLFLPYLSNPVYKRVLKFKEDRVNSKIKSDHKVLLDPGKALELYQELTDNKANLAKMIEEKKEEILALTQEREKLFEGIDYLDKRIKSLDNSQGTLNEGNIKLTKDIQKLKNQNYIIQSFIRLNFKDDKFLNVAVYLINKYSISEISEFFEEVLIKSQTNEPIGIIKSHDAIFEDVLDCKLLDCLTNNDNKTNAYYVLNDLGQRIYDSLKEINIAQV